LVYGEKVIGMMFWTFGCGEEKFPAVYADITKTLDWFTKTMLVNERW
jgi:hypothetical protein